MSFDVDRLISSRARGIDASGIRRVFALGATMRDPINLSIGQPDFAPPEAVATRAAAAIREGHNGYTQTWGAAELRTRTAEHLKADVGWDIADTPGAPGAETELLITSGTSGGLMLAAMALLGPGDEMVIPDPYFVCYPTLAHMCDANAVLCDTYPDFRLTAERVEPLITDRTKLVLANSPSNPAGVVMTADEWADLSELCRAKGVVLLSDEIYDEFTFRDARSEPAHDPAALPGLRCPSPARRDGSNEHVLLVRGFGKTFGVTGWRLGYVAGAPALVNQMAKIQQYTFVCPPTPLQHGVIAAFDSDMSAQIDEYQSRRDTLLEVLSPVTNVAAPGGAFYAFVEIPESLGLTGTQVFEKCVERNVLLIPGGVFSPRDTHVRVSLTAANPRLREGAEILRDIFQGR
ncbi:MAG: pyridoxal phosphate-dependent aminotransferase [Planctomycetota bacterium]